MQGLRLLEAELVTTSCLASVLKGKAYAKALFCPMALLNLVQKCNRENLDITLQDPSTLTILERYASYEARVRKDHLGKTATFWLSVIEHICPILMLQFSVKTNNFSLFHKCNRDMADLFFAYDGPNYSW